MTQILSNTIKQKRKEMAGKWDVPLPKVSFLKNILTLACLDVIRRINNINSLQFPLST